MSHYPSKHNTDGSHTVTLIGGPFDGDQRRINVDKNGSYIIMALRPELSEVPFSPDIPSRPILCDEVHYRIIRIARHTYVALFEDLLHE